MFWEFEEKKFDKKDFKLKLKKLLMSNESKIRYNPRINPTHLKKENCNLCERYTYIEVDHLSFKYDAYFSNKSQIQYLCCHCHVIKTMLERHQKEEKPLWIILFELADEEPEIKERLRIMSADYDKKSFEERDKRVAENIDEYGNKQLTFFD
tara:strand:+ start:175 stop:630 length:456 start_codon:yes stop_codon:yes gene_type:complete